MLQRDGRNFADWYRHTHQERPDLTDALTKDLIHVLGAGFHGIRLEQVGHDARSFTIVFNDQEAVILGMDTNYGLTRSPMASAPSSYCMA